MERNIFFTTESLLTIISAICVIGGILMAVIGSLYSKFSKKGKIAEEREVGKVFKDIAHEKEVLNKFDVSEKGGKIILERERKAKTQSKKKVVNAEKDLYELYKSAPNPDSIEKKDRNYSEDLMDMGDAYIGRTHLMSPPERDVYKVLEKAYGDRYRIFCQVRVVDLIQPNRKKHHTWTKEYYSLFRQLSQWHFDYVLCEKEDFKIFCALELDDHSHEKADRMKRDRILNKACEVAGIRLERMKLNHEEKRIELIKPSQARHDRAWNVGEKGQ